MSTRSLLLAAALLLPACGWDSTPDEDAGDAAWVMATVPTLLGRATMSGDELLALTSIAQTSGREAVVDVLLERPEFSRYWALALLDHQQLDLSGLHRVQSDCLYPEDESAFAPRRYEASHYDDMDATRAATIVGDIVKGSAGNEYIDAHATSNLDVPYSHLLEAAIEADRLDVALSAYIPVLASSHATDASASHDEAQQRRELTDRFTRRVLNRDLACIGCHNGEYSTTDDPLAISGGWDRTHPVTLDWEGGLFDWEDRFGGHRNGTFGGPEVDSNIRSLFNSHVWQADPTPEAGLSHRPYGLRQSCVTRRGANGSGKTYKLDIQPSTPIQERVYFAGLESHTAHTYDVLDVSEQLFAGARQDWFKQFAPEPADDRCPIGWFDGVNCYVQAGMPTAFIYNNTFYTVAQDPTCPTGALPDSAGNCAHFPAPAGTTAFIYNGNWYTTPLSADASVGITACIGCHGGSANGLDPGFAEIPDWRIYQALMSPPPFMADICQGDGACARDYVAAVRQAVPFSEPKHPESSESAMSTLAAMQLVDHVVEEVSGTRLTLAHGLPRNAEQSDVLFSLTQTFLSSQWSLRELLKEIVLSGAFNRVAPDMSQQSPYSLPQIFEPYLRLQGGQGEDWNASVGDMVHRRSVTHLTQRVHHALGWPSSWTPSPSGYPSMDYLTQLGRFQEAALPGWDDAILPTLLTWDETMGACQKPTAMAWTPELGLPTTANDVPGAIVTDWIDVLAAEASTSSTLTLRETIQMVKERLIQDPRLDIAEEGALETLFQVPSGGLGSLASSIPGLEANLRNYCGAVVTSPQFMLGGGAVASDAFEASDVVVEGSVLPDRPAWRGQPTDYAGWCAEYGGQVSMGACVLPGVTHNVCPDVGWWHDMNDLPEPASDSLNCQVAPIPAGSDAFIWSNQWYVEQSPLDCPMGTPEGQACYLIPKPQNGYIDGNDFITVGSPMSTCPSGWTSLDPGICLYATAPPGTTAFEQDGNWYITAELGCAIGEYDGANCYVGTPPAGRSAFLYGGYFYFDH